MAVVEIEQAERPTHAITFAEAEAKSPRIRQIGDEIRNALINADVWAACEQYLYGTAQTGSVQFNHANVVREIRAWDKRANRGRIGNFGMTDIALWRVVQRQLKHHFDISRGQIVGLLEDKSEQSDE